MPCSTTHLEAYFRWAGLLLLFEEEVVGGTAFLAYDGPGEFGLVMTFVGSIIMNDTPTSSLEFAVEKENNNPIYFFSI